MALGNLKRRGLAVTAILNMYDVTDFAMASGPLLSQGIETRHLIDESAIVTICRRLVLRG